MVLKHFLSSSPPPIPSALTHFEIIPIYLSPRFPFRCHHPLSNSSLALLPLSENGELWGLLVSLQEGNSGMCPAPPGTGILKKPTSMVSDVWETGSLYRDSRHVWVPRVWPGKGRGSHLLSAVLSFPAACGDRSVAARRPPDQAVEPGCASAPHTVSPFPGRKQNHKGDKQPRQVRKSAFTSMVRRTWDHRKILQSATLITCTIDLIRSASKQPRSRA